MLARDDIPYGFTRDERGNTITYKASNGHWSVFTYDEHGVRVILTSEMVREQMDN